MAEIVRINMEKARFEPESEFGTPEKLAGSIAMTRGQKIASLQRWEMQVRDRFKCPSNRAEVDPEQSARDFSLMEQIRAVLDNLKSA